MALGRSESRVLRRQVGLALVALSFVFYAALLSVPFLPLTLENRITLSGILVISGEASFWVAVLILGKEIVSRYRNLGIRARLRSVLASFRDAISRPAAEGAPKDHLKEDREYQDQGD